MKAWVNDLNTTSFRIAISVMMAAVLCTVVTGAIVLLNWMPTTQQSSVLTGVGAMILTMMGFDVIQFIGKRRTDADYVAAKVGTPRQIDARLTAEVPIPVTPVVTPAVTQTVTPAVTPDVPDPVPADRAPDGAPAALTRDD